VVVRARIVYKAPMQRVIGIAALVFVGCGGAQKKDAADGSDLELLVRNPKDPGMQCLMDAEVVRQPPTDAPERIDLAHIVVRHAGVNDAGDVTRTREEACLRANEAREKLFAGGDWDTVYAEYSDAKSATQGVLYDVTQGSLEQRFAGAAFSLQVDELSYPVETKRGFHIIWRKK
jgi:NIMA-interacting peptidyl-prolyl cis-trans isomerase 1